MATRCKDKAVLVTVYVEKTRRRVSSNQQNDRRQRRNLHQIIKQELIQHKHGGASKGYNRRAELLLYSQLLRESARSVASTPLKSKPVSSDDQQASNKVVAVPRETTYSKTPACFDNWGILIPSFLRPLKKTGKKKQRSGSTSSNTRKMKAAMKSLQMQKRWRFFSKLISKLHKHR